MTAKPRPPRALEAIVGVLLPPACREVVLGDLHELYESPLQYLATATFAVPCVISSRIRRTADPPVLLLEAFAMYVAFLAAALASQGMAFLSEASGLLRLAIPPAAGLIALMLADAYASPGGRSPLAPLRDATLSVALAMLAQVGLGMAAPTLVLPNAILIGGGAASVLMVATLRMLFPPSDHRPRGAT
jgi:hypothetical protein